MPRNRFIILLGLGYLLGSVWSLPPALADHPTVGFSEDNAGPIQTVSAIPIPKGRFGVSNHLEYQKVNSFSDQQLREFAASGRTVDSTDYLFSSSLGLAYGATEDLTLLSRLLYFVKRDNIREGELEDGEVKVDEHGDGIGFGDLSLLTKWRLLRDPVEVAPMVGLKVPTGETTDKDEANKRLETEHQPGTGSWDGIFGLALSKVMGPWTWSASGLYTWVTRGAQKTELGDRFVLGIGGSYRLGESGHSHHGGEASHSHHHWTTDLVLEGLWEHEEPLRIRGRKIPEKGGSILWLAPGLRINFGLFSWATSIGVPFGSNLNGAQHEPEFKVHSIVSAGF
jgi:hypothetical protein